MKTSTITKTLGLLALLGSSAGMAASLIITASTLTPNINDNFTMTITGNAENTFTGTMGLAFDATKVQYISGAALAPFTVYTKNSPANANPTVFDIEAPATQNQGGAYYNVAVLTFKAIGNGLANIVIDDDGGTFTGWFDADTFDYIPATYTQADVCVGGGCNVVPVPAAAWLFVSALGGLAGLRRRTTTQPA